MNVTDPPMTVTEKGKLHICSLPVREGDFPEFSHLPRYILTRPPLLGLLGWQQMCYHLVLHKSAYPSRAQ